MKKPVGDNKKSSLEDELDVFEEFEVEKEGPKPKAKTKTDDEEIAKAAEEFDLSIPETEDTDTEKMQPEGPAAESRGSAPAASALAKELLELAPDVPVNVVAVIGKISTNVGDLMKLKMGSVVSFNRPPSEIVDIVANGRLIARGELVEIDGKLGVKVIKLLR